MRVISRSKMSSFLVLLAPILIVFLVGTAFSSSSLSNIFIGVSSQEYSTLTRDIIASLESEQMNVEEIETEDLCIEKIKQGTIHLCAIFPPEMSVKGNTESIRIHVDNSRMNLAYILLNKIDSKISLKSSELGIALADDLLRTLEDIRESLPQQKSNISSAVSNIESIDSQADAFSEISMDSLIYKLENAVKQIESIESGLDEIEIDFSSIKSDINSVKTGLENSEYEIQGGVTEISKKTKSSKDTLVDVSKKIDILIESISLITTENPESVVMPIKTEVLLISEESSNWKHLFPTLTTLIILLSSIVLSSSIILTERRAKSKFRNFMTPTSDISFVLGAYMTSLIVLVFQLVLLFTGTYYITGLNILEYGWGVILVLFLSSSVFITTGMLIGYLFKSDETTILASISVASLFIFFSNAIVPIESIRGTLRYLAIYNPFFITDSLLKKIILFGNPMATFYSDLIILGGIFLVLVIITLFARKMTKRFV